MERLPLAPTIEELSRSFPDAKVIQNTRHISQEDFDKQKSKQETTRSSGGVIGIVWQSDKEVGIVERTIMHAGPALPGGTVEPGETFPEAFIREMKEELEVDVLAESVRLRLIEDRRFISPSGEELSLVLALFEGIVVPGQKITQTPQATAEGLTIRCINIHEPLEAMIFSDGEKLREAIADKLLG